MESLKRCSVETLLEQWGAWSLNDINLGYGKSVMGDYYDISLLFGDDEMVAVDRAITRLHNENKVLWRVVKIKFTQPMIDDNGCPVPASDHVVAAKLRVTSTEVGEWIGQACRYIEGWI